MISAIVCTATSDSYSRCCTLTNIGKVIVKWCITRGIKRYTCISVLWMIIVKGVACSRMWISTLSTLTMTQERCTSHAWEIQKEISSTKLASISKAHVTSQRISRTKLVQQVQSAILLLKRVVASVKKFDRFILSWCVLANTEVTMFHSFSEMNSVMRCGMSVIREIIDCRNSRPLLIPDAFSFFTVYVHWRYVKQSVKRLLLHTLRPRRSIKSIFTCPW